MQKHASVHLRAARSPGNFVYRVMQIVSKPRDQHAEGKPPLILNFIMSVGQDPEMLKLRSLTRFYVVHVKIYLSPKCPLQCNCSRAPAIRTVTAARYVGVWPTCGEAQISGQCDIPKEELKNWNGGNTSRPNMWLRELERWQCVRCKASEKNRLAQPPRPGCAANDCITYI